MKVYLKDGTTWSEPHFQMKFLKLDNWLVEEYCKLDLKIVEELVDLLAAFAQGTVDSTTFFEKCISSRIVFEEIPENRPELDIFRFDPSLGVTIVPMPKSRIENIIENSEYQKNYTRLLKTMVVHEDTHKQQFDRYIGYNKDYILPELLDPSAELSQRNIAYFSQTIEADAYGRQFGEELLQKYPNKTAYWIFENVIKKNVSTTMDEIVTIYRNPKISKDAFKHFWRALYDYLVEEKSAKSKKESYRNLNEVYEMLIKALKEKKVSQTLKF